MIGSQYIRARGAVYPSGAGVSVVSRILGAQNVANPQPQTAYTTWSPQTTQTAQPTTVYTTVVS